MAVYDKDTIWELQVEETSETRSGDKGDVELTALLRLVTLMMSLLLLISSVLSPKGQEGAGQRLNGQPSNQALVLIMSSPILSCRHLLLAYTRESLCQRLQEFQELYARNQGQRHILCAHHKEGVLERQDFRLDARPYRINICA